jgi:hypothetical protein
MRQVQVKVRPQKREHEEPERDYGDPEIARAKAAAEHARRAEK